VSFWERMQAATKGGGGTPEFMSTHPSHETRIRDLTNWLPQADYRAAAIRQRGFVAGTDRNAIFNAFLATFNLAWEIDVWGRIRRTIESDSAAAQASAADLMSARLSAQSSLVTNYYSLRISDARSRLFEESLAAYGRSLQIVQNQVDAGIASQVDLTQAQTLYEQTRAQLVAEGVNRLHQQDMERSWLVVTHYQRLLNYIVPDIVHVMIDGRIIKTGGKDLALKLDTEGYDWVAEEAGAAASNRQPPARGTTSTTGTSPRRRRRSKGSCAASAYAAINGGWMSPRTRSAPR